MTTATKLHRVNTNIYKLRNWIPLDKLDWNGLSENLYINDLLSAGQENIHKISWYNLSRNPNAIHLL
jgi:hypothetical protein